MAFTPDNIDYIRVMSKVKGVTMTQYVNGLIDSERAVKNQSYNVAKAITKNESEDK